MFHGQSRESHPMVLSVGYHTAIEGRPVLSDGLFGHCSQLQYQAAVLQADIVLDKRQATNRVR